MELHEIDSTIERLRTASEAIAANLLDVELGSTRSLLETSELSGESSERWAQARATFAQLWQWSGQLEQLLERAAVLRGRRGRPQQRRIEELSELLQGRSIELSIERVPLEQRDLLGGTEAPLSCTPDELLVRCSEAFELAKAVLVEAGRAWDELLPRLAAARARLEQNAELAAALGETGSAERDRILDQISRLTARLLIDPLSCSEQEVAQVEASADQLGRDLDGLDEVRRRFAAHLQEARGVLDELGAAAGEGAQAHEEALAKIRGAAVPEPQTVGTSLARELEDVESLARQGAWREARTALSDWNARSRSLLQEMNRIAAENRAPIDRRNELRGLLDAFQAKAAGVGLIEDPELGEMLSRARECLFTAPADLERAGELVDAYRRAIADRTSARGAAR